VFGGTYDQEIISVTAGGPGLVAVGYEEWMVGSGNDHVATVWTSTDGYSWGRVPRDETLFGGTLMFSVTAGGPGLVAVGHKVAGDPEGGAAVWVSSPRP